MRTFLSYDYYDIDVSCWRCGAIDPTIGPYEVTRLVLNYNASLIVITIQARLRAQKFKFSSGFD